MAYTQRLKTQRKSLFINDFQVSSANDIKPTHGDLMDMTMGTKSAKVSIKDHIDGEITFHLPYNSIDFDTVEGLCSGSGFVKIVARVKEALEGDDGEVELKETFIIPEGTMAIMPEEDNDGGLGRGFSIKGIYYNPN